MTTSAIALRKWYFATNTNGLRNAFDQIKIAVLSCKANTHLEAYCIVDQDGGDSDTASRIQWIKSWGVQVIPHRAAMLDLLRPKFGEAMNVFSGHWLRCDIPDIESEDEFILYTDIDVLFMKALPKDIPAPKFLSCAPEHSRKDYSYFNSGVMIMNIPALRESKADLFRVVEGRLSITAPYDDQSALNELFSGRWEHLPSTWNWKPYWGRNDEANIVHFHGPKPAHASQMLTGNLDGFGDDFRVIFERNPEGYRHYLKVIERLTDLQQLESATY